MSDAVEQRFVFLANAVALGGRIRREDDYFIDAVASSCLPPTGGQAKASSRRKRYGNLLTYRSASTCITGDFVDTETDKAVHYTHGNHSENMLPARTVVEASLEGLRIIVRDKRCKKGGRRMLQIDKLQARLETRSDRKTDSMLNRLDVTIKGVSVDNRKLQVDTETGYLLKHPTMRGLRSALREDKELRSRFPGLKDEYDRANGDELDTVLSSTVVTGIRWKGREAVDVAIAGNKLIVPAFGSIYFGEVLLYQDVRRLTLLRFQLGSPDGGEGSGPDVSIDGTTIPPKRSDS